jgi:hypothetical protein
MTDLASARRLALRLPGAVEEPHFEMSSFRVNGKIFATAPPDGSYLHVFVGEDEIAACVAEDPDALEPLRWGQRLRGLRILLANAADDRVAELLAEAWRRKASKRLVADFDPAQPPPFRLGGRRS